MANCTVCANPILRKAVDGSLDDGVTGAGTSRYLAEMGANVNADIINRHKQHYKPAAEREKGTRKRDFAVLVRDKAIEQFENGEIGLENKEYVPGINAGLKAQALIDGREKQKTKQQSAELAFAIIQMIQGGQGAVALLDDGNTIDGDYEVVE